MVSGVGESEKEERMRVLDVAFHSESTHVVRFHPRPRAGRSAPSPES